MRITDSYWFLLLPSSILRILIHDIAGIYDGVIVLCRPSNLETDEFNRRAMRCGRVLQKEGQVHLVL